jgi:hypothetical protein
MDLREGRKWELWLKRKTDRYLKEGREKGLVGGMGIEIEEKAGKEAERRAWKGIGKKEGRRDWREKRE